MFFRLRQRLARTTVVWVLAALTVAGCGTAAEESQEPTPRPTDTLVPPTETATMVPPTPTLEPTPRPTDTLIPPTETATRVPPTPTLEPTEFPAVGTDTTIDLPEGNVDDGAFQARRWGCEECHITYTHGPLFPSSAISPSVSERAAARIEDPSYTGRATTAEEYLVESILLPQIYLVEGYPTREEYAMDDDLGERLTAQDLADILAWLSTIE